MQIFNLNKTIKSNYTISFITILKNFVASLFIVSFLVNSLSTNLISDKTLSPMTIIRRYYLKKYDLFSNKITDDILIEICNDLELKRNFIIEQVNKFVIYRKEQKKNNFKTMSKKDTEKLNFIFEQSINLWG